MRRTVKSRINIGTAISALFVGLIAVMAILLILKALSVKSEPVYRSVSMSEEASARAYIWLNEIDDMPLSYTDIKGMMGDIQLKLVLTPTGEKGKYMQTLAEGTFGDCEGRARAGLEKAYREVLKHRFLAAGYEGEMSETLADDMMREAYGISISEYLESCEVQLLPTLEELTGMYSGEAAYE